MQLFPFFSELEATTVSRFSSASRPGGMLSSILTPNTSRNERASPYRCHYLIASRHNNNIMTKIDSYHD
jgi:hypothetical protein